MTIALVFTCAVSYELGCKQDGNMVDGIPARALLIRPPMDIAN